MLKKIMLWTLYLAFVGILILAGINRTGVKIWDNDGVLSRIDNGQKDFVSSTQDETIGSGNGENGNHDAIENVWVTLVGTVSSILPRGMVVVDANGQLIEVARRPWRFAQEQGFAPQVGDQVTLDGFYENEVFEVASLINMSRDQIVCLRDGTGSPLRGKVETEVVARVVPLPMLVPRIQLGMARVN